MEQAELIHLDPTYIKINKNEQIYVQTKKTYVNLTYGEEK